MKIVVNGDARETESETVAQLAGELVPAAPQTLLIERNGTALLPSEWSGTRLASGDRFEVLRISAGG